jgi:hypothetical protein
MAQYHRSNCGFHSEDVIFLRNKLIPPTHGPALVGPLQQCFKIGANVLGSPARPGLGLALERRVGRAEERLADVVEAVRRVVAHLLGELDATVSLLEMLDEVRLPSELAWPPAGAQPSSKGRWADVNVQGSGVGETRRACNPARSRSAIWPPRRVRRGRMPPGWVFARSLVRLQEEFLSVEM